MRRFDRQIKDSTELREIIDRADVCRIAFADGSEPYIVTMNFGCLWDGDRLTLYFHCAKAGRKIDLLGRNSRVCFEMDIDHELFKDEVPCRWGMKFRSIVGYGALEIVKDPAERHKGIGLVLEHYGFPGQPEPDERMMSVIEVLRLDVEEFAGKKKA